MILVSTITNFNHYERTENICGQMSNYFQDLIKFIDQNYKSWEQILFWPDLVACHYKKENLYFWRDKGIAFVEKAENPPNAPQIRPNGLQIHFL